MTIISPQTSCSSISSDTITISSFDTITLNDSSVNSGIYYTGTGLSAAPSTITISNGGSSGSGYTIGSIGAGTGYEWSQTFPVEWVNAFPDFDRIKKMCEQYPALKIVYEKFVTTYKLVKDDYDNPKD